MVNKLLEGYKIILNEGLVSFLKRLSSFISFHYKFRYGYYIAKSVIIQSRKKLIIQKRAEIKDYVIIRGSKSNVEIGEYTLINPFTVIYSGSGVKIGKNVMIAPHCMIASGNHGFKQTEVPIRHAEDISKGPIIIGDGVWIGANSVITDGVIVGHEAVVAAGSVVTKSVKPWDIVGGVPAKVIGLCVDAGGGFLVSFFKKLTAGECGCHTFLQKKCKRFMLHTS